MLLSYFPARRALRALALFITMASLGPAAVASDVEARLGLLVPLAMCSSS